MAEVINPYGIRVDLTKLSPQQRKVLKGFFDNLTNNFTHQEYGSTIRTRAAIKKYLPFLAIISGLSVGVLSIFLPSDLGASIIPICIGATFLFVALSVIVVNTLANNGMIRVSKNDVHESLVHRFKSKFSGESEASESKKLADIVISWMEKEQQSRESL